MAQQGQKISDSALAKLEQQIADKFDSIKGQVHTLQGTIDSLEGHWRGIGAGAFDSKQSEINTSLVRMGNILAKFVDAMNTTRKLKNDNEDEIRASVQAIDVHDGAPSSALSSY
ncbi:WXG100 family type VII secretion target [Streptomyces sp. NPDC050560]|uniref:WXG100 family type VII secretion target n=1 Tax=Streptomyces sp. NPDC050560 TaxID=3365630 RepID=UPI0037ADBAC1